MAVVNMFTSSGTSRKGGVIQLPWISQVYKSLSNRADIHCGSSEHDCFTCVHLQRMIELTLFQQMTYVFQQEFGLYILLAAIVFGFVLSFAVSFPSFTLATSPRGGCQ